MTNHSVVSRSEWHARAALGSWLGAALGVVGVLVPKCPLCVAAYLCLFGVSASSAQAVARLGAPFCIGLILTSVLGTALLVARRGGRLGRRGALDSGGSEKPAALPCCGRSS